MRAALNTLGRDQVSGGEFSMLMDWRPIGSRAEDMPVGPLRLLALAKAATSLDKETDESTGAESRGTFPTSTSSLDPEDPCPDVQRAMSFLLQSSTPQVSRNVESVASGRTGRRH